MQGILIMQPNWMAAIVTLVGADHEKTTNDTFPLNQVSLGSEFQVLAGLV